VTTAHVVWYVARGSAVAAQIGLSVALALGMMLGAGIKSPRWPMAATVHVHRAFSIAASALIGVHVAAILADSFLRFSPLDAVVPFNAPYRSLWVGLGTICFDMLLLVLLTTAVRRRIGYRRWRLVHRLAFPIWGLAVIHSIGAGTDAPMLWLQLLTGGCVAIVVGGGLLRLQARPLPATLLAATAAVSVLTIAGTLTSAGHGPRRRPIAVAYAVTARSVTAAGPATSVLTIVGSDVRRAAMAYRVDVVFRRGTVTQALLQLVGRGIRCRVPLASYTPRHLTALCGNRTVSLQLTRQRDHGTFVVGAPASA
jgi:sulfoxide reductase heme-binding subunit YedZ